jgi:Protein of unknown function (DUF3570)
LTISAAGRATEPDPGEILGQADSARIDEVRLRLTSYSQEGHGYQSVAGSLAGPGSERALIIQPQALIGIRQSSKIHHEVVIPIDIVSAASTNAIDILSHASGVNEAGGAELTSRFDLSSEDQLTSHLAWHEEEPLGSGSFGLGATHALADDNAVLGFSGQATFDRFDYLVSNGKRHGKRERTSLNGNLSLSQLLSPTAVFDLNYGLTFQQGTLQTTYNSVPLVGGTERADEIFPRTRTRQGVQARVAQHLPASRTTVRAAYRYYWDSFQLRAHTAELEVHQYLAPRLIARGSYRYYAQTGVDFFATAFSPARGASARTSDSDLAPFGAHEWGFKLLWLAHQKNTLDLSYAHYARDNGLIANIVSFGYGGLF